MHTENDDLEPIDPETAVALFLDDKAMSCTEATVRNHRYRLKHFLEWCEREQFEDLNELSGRDIQQYRLWLGEKDEIGALTLKNQLSGFRVFLQWAGSIEAVPEDLYTKLMIPRVRRSERSSEQVLETEQAEELLEYLARYEYASIEHVLLAFLWETGMRIGAARSIDLKDVSFDDECVELRHRPDVGTTLKNGKSGERLDAISADLAEVLHDHVAAKRHDVTDEFDREPLLTTRYGRMTRNTMRRRVNRVTAPCYLNKPCSDCQQNSKRKCPDAVSSHAIRRGSLTHYLTNDIPVEIVGDRMDVSRMVLDKHYDKRSREVKLEQRRRYLDSI